MSETTSPAAAGPASPDARDAATDPGTFNAPRRDLATSLHRPAACGHGTLQALAVTDPEAPREAATAVKPPQPTPVRSNHGIDWDDAGIGAASPRRDRPRVCGRHDDPAAQAPQTPNGDCPLTARAQHRRERGAGMRGPPPDPGREAAPRRSRRKAQATNQSASRVLRTNGSSARPSPAGCCFVCDCARVHDTARASQPPMQGPSARSRSASVSSTVPL
jgi:hypothetical protein